MMETSEGVGVDGGGVMDCISGYVCNMCRPPTSAQQLSAYVERVGGRTAGRGKGGYDKRGTQMEDGPNKMGGRHRAITAAQRRGLVRRGQEA